MALPYIMGTTARSGFTAFQLAARGLDAPATAFEGEKGMLASYSDEPAEKIEGVFATLGQTWRIFGNSYKTVPTETITHAPIECALALLARANGRIAKKMTFAVEPIVVKIADERRERFGNPSSELTARFDLRYCAAAAWTRGRFTLAEMYEPTYTDAAILDLRARIELVADPARKTFDGCELEIEYTDGSTDSIVVDDFLGTPGRPMSDAQLSDVFRASADGLLPAGRADAILDAVWALHDAPDLNTLLPLLTFR
jgi:2-methylcitrate dehydratase PrpD